MENEIWKDIEGYEGLYQVSNLGRVKSLERIESTIRGGRYIKERILSPSASKARYYSVPLTKNKKSRTSQIHRLVAKAFLSNPFEYPCVNHKDGNCLNNRVENLEWCTQGYNVCYAHATEERRIRMSQWLEQKQKNLEKTQKSQIKTKKQRGKKPKPVCVYSLDLIPIQQYSSAAEAVKMLNIENADEENKALQAIRACCGGRKISAFGFKWRYA
ncbi:MAG: hypothetical protein HDS16_05345 [Bacteroides sp.]|nr:hypothetical protein [Bacteroides sp.]